MTRFGGYHVGIPCLALLFVLSSASVARAELMDFRGSGHASAVNITVMNGSTTLLCGNVMAGELNWAWLGGTPAGFATDFYTYCVDATQYLHDPQTVSVRSTTALVSTVANAGAKVAWLFETFANSIRTSGTNIQGAALQVAIWEALYDTSQNLSGGSFRIGTTGAVRTQADAYLTALYSSNYLDARATLLDVAGINNGQDQVTSSVAEPSTLLLLAVGSLILARRRQQMIGA